jgi:hypothetical protein
MRGGLLIYRLKDFHDEEINGTFYQSELQKVDVRDDDKERETINNISLNGYTGQRNSIRRFLLAM